MVTHYEPFIDPEEEPIPSCGTPSSENTLTDNNWRWVDCKKCIKQRSRIEKAVEANEKIIVKQMGEQAEFFNRQ